MQDSLASSSMFVSTNERTSGTQYHNSITTSGPTLSQGRVNRHATTEQRRGNLTGYEVRDRCHIVSGCDDISLESAGDPKAGDLAIDAATIPPFEARYTLGANARHPLDW